VVPCDFRLAADFADKSASVTHGGEGINGGRFVAACISAAFCETDVLKIIENGLPVISADCEYAKMTRSVIAFHRNNPDEWVKCFEFIKANYWDDRYPGICHIIPNSALMILSLLYGKGVFSDTINICNMCGWSTVEDTDAGWTYSGWTQYADSNCSGGQAHGESTAGQYGQFTFTGTGVRYYAWKGSDGGNIQVQIDGVSKGNFSLINSTELYQEKIYEFTCLTNGTHTIKLISQDSNWAMVDYIQYLH
jgi:hypothetical protein